MTYKWINGYAFFLSTSALNGINEWIHISFILAVSVLRMSKHSAFLPKPYLLL